jgi:hypothetical protein
MLESAVYKNLIWSFPSLENYMMIRNNDDWVHNAFTIQKIKRLAKENSNAKILVYLGGSSSLESISTDENMELKLKNKTGKNISFFSITSSYMTYAEATMILSELGPINATYLISIAPNYLSKPTWAQILHDERTYLRYFYLPVPSRVREILAKYGLDLGLFYTFRTFRSTYALAHQFKHKISSKIFHTEYDRHAAPEKLAHENNNNLTSRWSALVKLHGNMNIQLLKLVIDTAQTSKNPMILIRMPNAPPLKDSTRVFEETLDKYLLPILKKEDVEYLDLREKAQWEVNDFRDTVHLISSGRKKFEDTLSSELKRYFDYSGENK